mgnify:CR=1 FL=1
MLQYGTLMHYLFEKIFREPRQVRCQWDEEELERRIRELIRAYAQENLGEMELLSGRELTPEELPKAAEAQVMESMERERRTRRRSFFATAALALIGIAAIVVGTWLAAHYLGSVPETDLEGWNGRPSPVWPRPGGGSSTTRLL